MDYDSYVLYIFWFKTFSLFSGMLAIYLGYKLFVNKIAAQSGEINGSIGSGNLSIRRASPGTFFVLFGSIIICYTVFTGFNIKINPNSDPDDEIEANFELHNNNEDNLEVEASPPPLDSVGTP